MVDTASLTPDDERVIEHLRSFRITTPQVLQNLFFRTATLNDIRFRFRRLRRAGCLGVASLYFEQPYYFLTPQAARELFQERDAGPLDEQRIVDAFAVLMFCSTNSTARKKLTNAEFAALFPELLQPHPPWYGYYLDQQKEKTRIGLVKVDRGFDYRRAPLYLDRFVKHRTRFPEWKQVIDHGEFAVTFVTAWPSKVARIQDVLTKHPQPAPCTVHLVEELRHIISGRIGEGIT